MISTPNSQTDGEKTSGSISAIKGKKWGSAAAAAGAVLFWLAVWQLCSLAVGRELLVPSPLTVALRLLELSKDGSFWLTCAASVGRIVGGFALAALLGALLAAAGHVFYPAAALTEPLMTAVRATPVASFIILALLWLPRGGVSVFIAVLIVTPIFYSNIKAGLLSFDRDILEMAELYEIPFIKRLGAIYLPRMLPHFTAACSNGVGFAWKAGISAEVLGNPHVSIGRMLYESKIYLETVDLFAWTAAVVLMSLVIEKLVLRLIRSAAENSAAEEKR